MTTARTLVFDVNGTLTDQTVFADRLGELGAPAALAGSWFAATLRDGFALTMAGAAAPYAAVARAVLIGLLADVDGLHIGDRPVRPDEAADHVMAGFDTIDPHPDVVPGLRALAASGHRLVTLSNGATRVAGSMLRRHDLTGCVDVTLSVDDAGAWKPHSRAYAYAAEMTGTQAADLLMVAVHPWDLDGAARAGLRTAFLNRTGAPWPEVFTAPDLDVCSLTELDEHLRRA